jgi:hypothetical protein
MNAYHVGQQVRVWARFTDIDGYAVDPTVITLKYVDPAGEVTTLTYETNWAVTREDTGEYYAEFVATRAGTWRYRWESSGALTAAAEGQFQVLRSAFA